MHFTAITSIGTEINGSKTEKEEEKMKVSEEQRTACRKILQEECANYQDGNCLLLEEPCPQMLSVTGLICKYFKDAVLAGHPQLYAEIQKGR